MPVHRFIVPSCSGFEIGGVRGPAVLSLFGEDLWPPIRGSFGLAGEEVRFFTGLKYGNVGYGLFFRLWVLDSVSIFGYFKIQRPVGLCFYQSLIGILIVVCETVTHLGRCGGTRLVPRENKLYVASNPSRLVSPHGWGGQAPQPHLKTLHLFSLPSSMALRIT